MRPETAVLHFWDVYKEAVQDKSITKPISYALYYTWKWVYEEEKSREDEE